jgi:succinylglutamic semialdehyde dehydrogenase
MNSAHLIGGTWRPIPPVAGQILESRSPADPSRIIWSGTPNINDVDAAVSAARAAQPAWEALGFARRAAILREFAALATSKVDELTSLLRDEVGKPTWDAKAEAQLLASKVDITLEEGPDAALTRVRGFELTLGPTKGGRCWFKPHGVMAVLGPFNFPAHLPNGHIIPALAMGNTIVFKPSDKTPAVGQFLAQLYHQTLESANAPKGVVNLVQGTAEIAGALASHRDIDGVLFTGSWNVGRKIMSANLDHPGRVLALEMGGNNPAVIMPDADLTQAVIETVRCAYITSGQRCTCTRRLIVHESIIDRVQDAIIHAARQLTIGDPSTNPFMGPVISSQARDAILTSYRAMVAAGATPLLEMTTLPNLPGHYITPGLLRVPRFTKGSGTPAQRASGTLNSSGDDIEVFGPLLRISACTSLDDAIEQANATDFGLAAAIFTQSQSTADTFTARVRAGCINWNTGTAGASSKLPFGGLGHSGNHRPAGAFSLDYCAYPVAGMIERGTASTSAPGMPAITV